MVLTYAAIRVTKNSNLELQLRISRQWFSRKILMNTQHLNFMGRTILLDNAMSRVSKSSKICPPNENISVNTYSYSCQ